MSSAPKSKVPSKHKNMSDEAEQTVDGDLMAKVEMESVKVAVRVRPFIQREKNASVASVLSMNPKKKTVTITNPQPREMNGNTVKKTFQFDSVFWSLECPDESGSPPAGQVDVYEAIGRPLVRHAFSGFNSCLFAYGQTGSGKTYTMMGGDPNALGGADAGVTPRLCLELFQTRERIEAEGHSRWQVEVGYIEVYNERVSDLLAKRKKGGKEEVFVEVREHPTKGVFIEGQRFKEVRSMGDVVELIEAGNRVRHTAATKMNDRSSRSHAIFMLMLREERSMQTAAGQAITTAGKSSRMNLVDLAGSERVAQSEVIGQQFSEARYINLSLTTLGRVIDMLADMAKNENSQWSMPPYRESKLTYILKDSLGGNSKTFMVATISPSALNYEETLSTLRYASRARDIVNMTRVNEDPRARRIRELEEQMELMRKDIQGKDPAYVAELEERLVLLEAEAQKRAADLHMLEKEREKSEIRDKMLRATEAERQELLGKARELERQVDESRRQAEYHEQMSQRLKEEHAQRERELLEQVRKREAEMESARRQRDADVLSGQELLRNTMADLERERTEREHALHALSEQQEQLNAALCDSRQSEERRSELQRQNTELARRMQQLESEREVQQRLLHELGRFRDERDSLEQAVALLRTELEEMDRRHQQTVYQLLAAMDMRSVWGDGQVARLCMEHENELNRNAQQYSDDRAAAERHHEELLQERDAALASTQATLSTLQHQLEESTATRRHLTESLEVCKSENTALVVQLQSAEDEMAAVIAERDRMQREMAATSDDLKRQLQSAEGEMAAVIAERDRMQREMAATSDDLKRQLQSAEDEMAAVIAERDRMQREMAATSDDLRRQLQSAEEEEVNVEATLADTISERDDALLKLCKADCRIDSLLKDYESALCSLEELRCEKKNEEERLLSEIASLKSKNESLGEDLRKAVLLQESTEIRLKYLRSLCRSTGVADGVDGGDYQMTRSVLSSLK